MLTEIWVRVVGLLQNPLEVKQTWGKGTLINHYSMEVRDNFSPLWLPRATDADSWLAIRGENAAAVVKNSLPCEHTETLSFTPLTKKSAVAVSVFVV